MTGGAGAAHGQRERSWLLRGLVVADAAALAVGLAGVAGLRLALDQVAITAPFDFERHLLASALMGVLVLVWFRLDGLYDLDRIGGGAREYASVFRAVAYAGVLVIGVSYFAGDRPVVSRSWLVLVALVVPGGLILERFTVRRIVRALRRRGRLQTRIAIVGASAAGVAIAAQLRRARNEGLIVRGFLDEYLPIGEPVLDGISVIGRPGDAIDGSLREEIDEYILVPQALPHQRLEEITAVMVARGRPILRMAVTPSSLLTNGFLVAERGFIPMVTLQRARVTGSEAVLKRSLDIVGAALLLVAVAPLAIYDLARAWLAGARPLFSRREVYDSDGRRVAFWLLAQEPNGPLLVRGLPAFAAVVIGRLSLVGPRPIPVEAGSSSPVAPALTGMRPGLTGPWRLLGDASLERQAAQDLAYVRNYTIWEDLRIIVQSARLLSAGSRGSSLGRWELGSAADAQGWDGLRP